MSKELGQGLESGQEKPAANFSNIDWLQKNEFRAVPDKFSSKYDKKREPKVQEGLKTIVDLKIEMNPLILLLAKWWENKDARAAIKSAIDAEAASKNIPADVYLQQILREPVDKLASVQNAVDRARYAITYFKPRGGVGKKSIFVQLKIDSILYNVDSQVLAEAKSLYPNAKDKAKLKKHILDAESTNKAELAEEL